MAEVLWADGIGAERNVLLTHPASVVIDFRKGKLLYDDEEPEPFHTPPVAIPVTASLDEQLEEERELFAQLVDEVTGKAVYTAGRGSWTGTPLIPPSCCRAAGRACRGASC